MDMEMDIFDAISETGPEDIAALLDHVLFRYMQLFPQCSVSVLSIDKRKDEIQQINETIAFLEKLKEIWDGIKLFWQTYIAPWFTSEKWSELLGKIKDSFLASDFVIRAVSHYVIKLITNNTRYFFSPEKKGETFQKPFFRQR